MTQLLAPLSILLTFFFTVAVLPTGSLADTQALSYYNGSSKYAYVGCWNETTALDSTRALNGGSLFASDNMTVAVCLTSCLTGNKGAAYFFAGLEYGRECWCAPTLSTLSTKLSESDCNFACKSNDTQACGGSLTISLYNLTAAARSAGVRVVGESNVLMAFSVALGVVAALTAL